MSNGAFRHIGKKGDNWQVCYARSGQQAMKLKKFDFYCAPCFQIAREIERDSTNTRRTVKFKRTKDFMARTEASEN